MFEKDSLLLLKELNKFIEKNHKDEYYIHKLFNLLETHDFNYDEPIIENNEICSFPTINTFVSQELNQKIKSYNKKQIIKWSVYSDYKIDCSLCIFRKNKNLSEKSLNFLIYAISFILSFSNHDLEFECNLVFLPDKKMFNNQFTPNEINSGMSSTTNDSSTIYVWRLEECIKVIFHECIHSLKFSELNDTVQLINHYNTKFNCNVSKMTINETYTEIWARILNCYFISLINKFHNSNFNPYTYFCFLLENEKIFSLIQSSKIQNFLIENPNYDINNTTNTLAYHVCVSELFDNLNNFLKLRFKEKNIFYLKNDKEFIKFFTDNKYTKNIELEGNKFYNKTFRMSAIGLSIFMP